MYLNRLILLGFLLVIGSSCGKSSGGSNNNEGIPENPECQTDCESPETP
ncbi:MAG: hypothetical protein HRU19_20515 [Pseudobacteriovorax sp.]|nr:hypothetical protein [Pseudobacteriovorax sp.]